jgi:hypothetical protein
MKTCLVALLLIVSFNVRGQDYQEKILYDSIKSTLIPFAIISEPPFEKGFYADSDGKFSINPELDSIMVSCVGYGASKVKLNSTGDTIFISASKKILEEVTVYASRSSRREDSKTIGFSKKSRISVQIPHGWELATLINQENDDLAGVINGINLKLKNANSEPSFRIHFYKNNNGVPGSEISFPNMIIKSNSGFNKNVKIDDLISYNIKFPEDGIFVAFESIKTDDSERPEFYLTKKYSQENTYCRSKLDKNEWHSLYESGLTRFLSDSRSLNLSVSVEVLFD